MRALLVLLLALAFAAGCGGGDDESGGTASASGEASCESVEAPEPREESLDAPTEPLESGKTYALTFDTSCGSFTVTLDQKSAPNTAASLVALAEHGYFDDTTFTASCPAS